MKPEEVKLLQNVAGAARELPQGAIDELCDALESLPDDASPAHRAAVPGIIPSQGARARASRLVAAWGAASHVSPANLAWGLRAASVVDDHHRRGQSVELVWTGPVPDGTVLRRTDQVLLDLVRSARHEIYLVTFAAYKIPVLNEAMLAAAQRGVEINLIFESQETGKTAFAAIKAVGGELEALSNIYTWPLDKRPKDAAGRHGSLHAKCAVSDGTDLLISSANLTEYALNMNMELGILGRGGSLPGRVVRHLQQLVDEETLMPV